MEYPHDLFFALDKFVTNHVEGDVLFATLPVRLGPGRYREPDVMFFRFHRIRGGVLYPQGADLVMEVVIGGAEDRHRDYVIKRAEYAAAGIDEYWIVDPEEEKITVLTRKGKAYRVHGEFGPGTVATSVLLPGFSVSVADVFKAGEGPAV